LGPGEIGVAHQANEHIAIDQMVLAVAVYLKTIEAWLREARGPLPKEGRLHGR
jgi:acetylornithine deacetylase/succinyl-diaminopimelate desuccinylase-like protein